MKRTASGNSEATGQWKFELAISLGNANLQDPTSRTHQQNPTYSHKLS